MGDIVVTATRFQSSDGNWLVVYGERGGSPGIRMFTPQQVSENESGAADPLLEVAIAVQCSTPPTCEKAKLAAQKLAKAVVQVITAAEASNPNSQVTLLGETISVGEILDVVMGTTYIVTDGPLPPNRGLGTADRATMTDTINILAILGTDPVTTVGGVLPGKPGYDSFPMGMVGLVLHEAAHMSAAGDRFFKLSALIARSDTTTGAGVDFYSNLPGAIEYSQNNEYFANELMTLIAGKIGLPLQGFRPFPGTPESPEGIYLRHNGMPYQPS